VELEWPEHCGVGVAGPELGLCHAVGQRADPVEVGEGQEGHMGTGKERCRKMVVARREVEWRHQSRESHLVGVEVVGEEVAVPLGLHEEEDSGATAALGASSVVLSAEEVAEERPDVCDRLGESRLDRCPTANPCRLSRAF
jgi:hypothetical protein